MKRIVKSIFVLILITSCGVQKSEPKETINIDNFKIVSLNGTLTEIISATGYKNNIVGVDVTSTHPESINRVPKVGHTSNLNTESILGLNPDVIVAKSNEIKPEVLMQLKASNVKLWLFNQDYSIDGTKKLIKEVCDSLQQESTAQVLIKNIYDELGKIKVLNKTPKVLFIYARGPGTMLVAGKNTPVDQIISLSGGINAVSSFEDFKPLTPEYLIEANPDVILMFTTGLESLKGNDGLLNIPGMANTNAGINKQFITMDGLFLTGFGPRLGEAIISLNEKLNTVTVEK